jgi:hypothetical protein
MPHRSGCFASNKEPPVIPLTARHLHQGAHVLGRQPCPFDPRGRIRYSRFTFPPCPSIQSSGRIRGRGSRFCAGHGSSLTKAAPAHGTSLGRSKRPTCMSLPHRQLLIPAKYAHGSRLSNTSWPQRYHKDQRQRRSSGILSPLGSGLGWVSSSRTARRVASRRKHLPAAQPG